MEERKMNTQQVIAETAKIIGSIEMPIAFNKISTVLAGCYNNLMIVLQMMEAEKNANIKPEENAEVENEHVNVE